jgi:uncharacterized membrane protein
MSNHRERNANTNQLNVRGGRHLMTDSVLTLTVVLKAVIIKANTDRFHAVCNYVPKEVNQQIAIGYRQSSPQ